MPTNKPQKTKPSKAGKSRAGNNAKTKSGKTRGGLETRFKPNDPETGFRDPRINRTGQNAKFTEVRHMAQKLFDETTKAEVTVNVGEKKIDTTVTMTRLENMLREWISSHDFQKQNRALEYAAGKVPDRLQVENSETEEFVKQNIDLFTDGQIDRLRAGESPLLIIAEILREYRDKQNAQ